MGVGNLVGAGLSAGKSAASGGKGGGDGGGGGGGGLDPAMVAWTMMQNLNKIRGRYADLGLGGSTMESMDEAGANLGALAQAAGLQQQEALTASQIGGQNVSNLATLANVANQQNTQSQTQQGIGDVLGSPGGATGGGASGNAPSTPTFG
jgi:hypothetical protein